MGFQNTVVTQLVMPPTPPKKVALFQNKMLCWFNIFLSPRYPKEPQCILSLWQTVVHRLSIQFACDDTIIVFL